MLSRKSTFTLLAVLLIAVGMSSAAVAGGWTYNFEGLTPGIDLVGQDGWTARGSYTSPLVGVGTGMNATQICVTPVVNGSIFARHPVGLITTTADTSVVYKFDILVTGGAENALVDSVDLVNSSTSNYDDSLWNYLRIGIYGPGDVAPRWSVSCDSNTSLSYQFSNADPAAWGNWFSVMAVVDYSYIDIDTGKYGKVDLYKKNLTANECGWTQVVTGYPMEWTPDSWGKFNVFGVQINQLGWGNTCYIDNLDFGGALTDFVPSGTVHGNVTLNGLGGDLSLCRIRVELIPTSRGCHQVLEVTPTSATTPTPYSIGPIAPGTYNVVFSANKWLKKVNTGVVVGIGASVESSATLKNGDVDGEGEVTTTDTSAVLSNLGASGAP